MPYVTTKEMLGEAAKNSYAVCAFNAENLNFVNAGLFFLVCLFNTTLI